MKFFKLYLTFLLFLLSANLMADDAQESSVKDRELDAEEDPLLKQHVDMLKNQKEENKFSYLFYSSLRSRYRHITNTQPVWEDSSSRVGFNSWYELAPKTWVLARYELGFNILKELGLDMNTDYDSFKSGETFYTRLAYVGFQKDENIVVVGKNWSTYYQVASFTDRFSSLGGDASGIFNAKTDGGHSGTGRANDVVQARFGFDKVELNLQLQDKQDIPYIHNVKYQHALGVSLILNPYKNFKIGLAYNYADIDLDTIPLFDRHSLNGSMSAYLIGLQWYSTNWYLGMTYTKNYNLQTTDNNNYIDSTGLELYAQYQLLSDIWLIGGYNYSRPDGGELVAENYLLSYGVIGLRYTVDEFSKMFYTELKLDQGKTSKYSKQNNQIVVGLRWSFEYSNY